MSTTNRIPEKPNSFKTVIISDDTDKTLAEWFSLNPRSDRQRVAIAADMYAVLSGCWHCGSGKIKNINGHPYCQNCGSPQ